jgi:hypothetical protein
MNPDERNFNDLHRVACRLRATRKVRPSRAAAEIR